ncbi:MAG: hypothetical protein ACMUHB_03290 [Thermoplasmatota archaeon]
MTWDWNTFWFIVIIVVLVIAFLAVLGWLISSVRRRKKGPSHVDLYFKENFRTIMDEWDMVTRGSMKNFKKDMLKRLDSSGSRIKELENKRKGYDKRMAALDRELTRLEGF